MICQYSNWLRAAAHELGGVVRHVEIDLLQVSGERILWVSDPHAGQSECPMPEDMPLPEVWRARRWWKVEGEPTWLVHDGNPTTPFLVGPFALVSRLCPRRAGVVPAGAETQDKGSRFLLWRGAMPEYSNEWSTDDWLDAGTYWLSGAGKAASTPPPP